jgi:hypothetical protein
VALVEEAALPQGAEGEQWCRYVIENAHATMTGWRRGSLQEVTHYARGYIEALNTHRNPSASLWTGRRRIAYRVAESVPPPPLSVWTSGGMMFCLVREVSRQAGGLWRPHLVRAPAIAPEAAGTGGGAWS